ncbi:MAG: Na+/H+ antiporter NhaA [Bacteroidales bacterium]
MDFKKMRTLLFHNEQSGGVLLILCTVVSLLMANTYNGESYINMWDTELFPHFTVGYFINDALMAIFFLLIGLELKREFLIGQLSNKKKAILPIFAAVGGMAVPALIYTSFNLGTENMCGWAIPTATDIAFSLAILSLLSKNVPFALKVFLTALAVVDDLGAIIVIAIFYCKDFDLMNLIYALSIFGILVAFNKAKINNFIPYIIGGIIMWYFMHNSGVHATISGVLLAFTIPFNKGEKTAPAHRLEHFLHNPVTFFILPLFALANTAIAISGSFQETLSQGYSLGILLGLFVGKPLGVILFSILTVKFGFSKLMDGVTWNHILGVGFIAGIGFTMSIFVTLLAFDNQTIINNAKLMILTASLLSGIVGYVYLRFVCCKVPVIKP